MSEEIENTQNFTTEQKSSVKVTSNSKGYTWEVKVYDLDPEIALKLTFALEEECRKRYSPQNE